MNLSDFLFTNDAYQFISQYVAPEMLIIVPVLIFINWLMEQTPNFKQWLIPYIVTVFGIVAGIVVTKSVEDGFIQGVLAAAVSILFPIVQAQMKKRKQAVVLMEQHEIEMQNRETENSEVQAQNREAQNLETQNDVAQNREAQNHKTQNDVDPNSQTENNDQSNK